MREIRLDDAPFSPAIAWSMQDGGQYALNAYAYDNVGWLRNELAGMEAAGFTPAGVGTIAGVATHEVGHLLKIWLEDTPAAGQELDDWLRANPIPLDVLPIERPRRTERVRLHERYAEGFAAWYHTPGGQQQAWVRELRELTVRLATLLRERG